jgi:hypothetical protein
MHARQCYNLTLYQLESALLVEAAIRGTKIHDPLFIVLFNPQLDTGAGIKIQGMIHERFSAMRTFNLQRNQVFCHKYLLW